MLNSGVNEPKLPADHWVPTRRDAGRIAVWYGVLSAAWISCSGWVLRQFVQDPTWRALLEDAKGWFFVAATALLLGVVLDRYFRRVQVSVRRIQDSETKLHLVGDNLPDGYVYQYTHDAMGKPRFTYISAGVERVHGITAAEVLQESSRLFSMIDLGQMAAFAAAEAESARKLSDFEMEFRIRKPDGEVRLLHVKSRPRKDAEGRVQWDGFAHDVTDLKSAEAALREREQQLQLFIEHSPAGIAVLDTNMRYLIVSQRWLSDYRLRDQTVIGRSHYEIFPEIPQRWKDIHVRCLQGAVEKNDADAFQRSDGSTDWVRWEIRPWRDGRGEIGGLMIFSEVITERKQAEQALRQSEANFRAMFEVASIGMGQADPHTGQWLRVNAKMCAITGYSNEEMLRMKVPEITHPEDRALDWELFQSVIRGEAPNYHIEKRYLRKDGEVAWVRVNMALMRDGAGQPIRTMATIEDITKRKRIEEVLRVQSAALEAAANAIVITDLRGDIEWTNPAFTKLTGYTREEAIGKKPSFLKSDQHDLAFYKNLWATILGGRVWRSEMVNRHKDGHLYTEEATITPVLDDRGAIRNFIAVKQDITERKRAELELEQTNNRLLSVSRQAGIAEFATGILHNVGNVLNSVGVASSCLAESLKKSKAARLTQIVTLIREHEQDLGAFFSSDPKGKLVPSYLSQLAEKLTGEQVTALQEIAELQRNVEHIKAIITVQQDSANGSNSSEPLFFTDLVEEALKMHANALARSGVQVVRKFEELPPAMLQKHRILQILVNLIRNAIQACDASAALPKEVKVCVKSSAERLQCAVADSGIGIADENLNRIFTFGFTTKKEGHGFGLHGASLAARDLGGSLSAESGGLGHGATFTLDLPLVRAAHTNGSS